MQENRRVEWLDGFKGIACVLIFIHHFLLIFFPAVHYGEAAVSYAGGYDTMLAQSPWSVFVNGNFLVTLFCMISGILISMQTMRLQEKNNLSNIALKRYFRLMMPLLPVGFLVYILLRLGWFSNLEASTYTQSPWAALYYQGAISLPKFFRSVFIDTWFLGDDTLSTAFWMLSKLFYGTFLSMILSVVAWKYQKRTWVLYVAVAICFFGRSDLLCAFALGTLLAWLFYHGSFFFNKIAGVPLILLGLILGAYPSGVVPHNFYCLLGDKIPSVDWHILGAFLTLYGLFSLPWVQRGLSIKPFRWLGKISYSVYLLHIPVLFAFTTTIFLQTKDRLGYLYSVGLSFVLSMIVLIVVSFLYNCTVEKFCARAQQRILGWFEPKESGDEN